MNRKILDVALEHASRGYRDFLLHTMKGDACSCGTQNGSNATRYIANKSKGVGTYHLLPILISADLENAIQNNPVANYRNSVQQKSLFDEVPLELVSECDDWYDLDL